MAYSTNFNTVHPSRDAAIDGFQLFKKEYVLKKEEILKGKIQNEVLTKKLNLSFDETVMEFAKEELEMIKALEYNARLILKEYDKRSAEEIKQKSHGLFGIKKRKAEKDEKASIEKIRSDYEYLQSNIKRLESITLESYNSDPADKEFIDKYIRRKLHPRIYSGDVFCGNECGNDCSRMRAHEYGLLLDTVKTVRAYRREKWTEYTEEREMFMKLATSKWTEEIAKEIIEHLERKIHSCSRKKDEEYIGMSFYFLVLEYGVEINGYRYGHYYFNDHRLNPLPDNKHCKCLAEILENAILYMVSKQKVIDENNPAQYQDDSGTIGTLQSKLTELGKDEQETFTQEFGKEKYRVMIRFEYNAKNGFYVPMQGW